MYETPESTLVSNRSSEYVLASRWSRLFASLVDTFLLFLILIPVMYFMGIFDEQNLDKDTTLVQDLILASVVIVSFFAINYVLLVSNGQTIGKKLFRIKIVTINGDDLSFSANLIPRYLVYFVPGNIPIVGHTFSIVNSVFIFRADKRCLHDHIGKTKVVCC